MPLDASTLYKGGVTANDQAQVQAGHKIFGDVIGDVNNYYPSPHDSAISPGPSPLIPTPPQRVAVKPAEDPVHKDFVAAAREGEGKIRLEYLLSIGANMDARDESGLTALYYAAFQRHNEIVRYLVDCGASPNPWHRSLGTPIAVAALRRHAGVVKKVVVAPSGYPQNIVVVGISIALRLLQWRPWHIRSHTALCRAEQLSPRKSNSSSRHVTQNVRHEPQTISNRRAEKREARKSRSTSQMLSQERAADDRRPDALGRRASHEDAQNSKASNTFDHEPAFENIEWPTATAHSTTVDSVPVTPSAFLQLRLSPARNPSMLSCPTHSSIFTSHSNFEHRQTCRPTRRSSMDSAWLKIHALPLSR